MTEAFNNAYQLPLFSRGTLILSEGYRSMSRFRFDEAIRFFNDVLNSDPESENLEAARRALKLCRDWQPFVSQSNNTEPSLYGDCISLYREFGEYDFANTPGEQQFREALLLIITNQMLEKNRIYTGEGSETVADLLWELGRHRKAEEVVRKQRKIQPKDFHLIYCLAQIQWRLQKWGEAKKIYSIALLYDPCGLPPERVVYQDLTNLIQSEGPEMAPALGWVRGLLPLVPPPEIVNFCSKAHRQAVECYRLLWGADRAVRNNNLEACVEYRKKLKAENPALYDEYFAFYRESERTVNCLTVKLIED